MDLFGGIRQAGCRTVAVAGLAKNTGKTVTLNTIIREAHRAGDRLLLASFGRDGEYRDALTEHRKPRIVVPPGALYATVEEFAGPSGQRETVALTDIRTTVGPVRLYRAGDKPVTAELLGLNRVSRLRNLKELAEGGFDRFLIDGALDRRAAAVPDLADGTVLATGAALGSDEQDVVRRTAAAVRRLTLPSRKEASGRIDDRVFPEHGALERAGDVVPAPRISWISGELPAEVPNLREGDAVWIPGALTDGMAGSLLKLPPSCRFSLIIRDGTPAFQPFQGTIRQEGPGSIPDDQ